jgi:hypothetical protein
VTDTHELSPDEWAAAKEEIRTLLIGIARQRSTITYRELAGRLTSVSLEPNSVELGRLLGEASRAEASAGRGMLSALVVQQATGKPGHGFFRLAQQLGRSVADQDQCLVDELNAVYAAWAS